MILRPNPFSLHPRTVPQDRRVHGAVLQYSSQLRPLGQLLPRFDAAGGEPQVSDAGNLLRLRPEADRGLLALPDHHRWVLGAALCRRQGLGGIRVCNVGRNVF